MIRKILRYFRLRMKRRKYFILIFRMNYGVEISSEIDGELIQVTELQLIAFLEK